MLFLVLDIVTPYLMLLGLSVVTEECKILCQCIVRVFEVLCLNALLTARHRLLQVRDNAIVFSMEHVRLIITADCVIIPQTGFERDSLATRFAAYLEESIIEASQEKQACSFTMPGTVLP